MIEIGINIVEIVTKGLYTNSLDIFREYVQNSCDAIDDAVDAGILIQNEGEIEIELDSAARRIIITDNGAGVNARNFERIMSKIGSSDKRLETDRGFRGIGRLCGLAYCRVARFSSTVKGETKLSNVTIDAEHLRQEFFNDNKSAEYVMRDVMTFDKADIDSNDHFFRVELIDIVDTNDVLLNATKVREYLSFVAPVTYSPHFYYRTEVYKYASSILNFNIAEYKILVNGEPLDKPYKVNVQTRMGKDEVFSVDFKNFYDVEGNLIAWSWVGLSNFRGVLDQKSGTADNMMRGIRLRTGNIQIGDADTLKKLFSETRGINYFIGEVHTIDTNLRPNSRRDYFEENESCNVFETELKKYFNELTNIYRTASDIRSAQTAIIAPIKTEEEFKNHSADYQKSHMVEYKIQIDKLNEAAEKAKKYLEKIRGTSEQNPDTPLSRMILRLTKNSPNTPQSVPLQPNKSKSKTEKPMSTFPPSTWRRDLQRLYNTIETIIIDNPKLSGNNLIDKIKSVLAK